jgi:hypothetical protein
VTLCRQFESRAMTANDDEGEDDELARLCELKAALRARLRAMAGEEGAAALDDDLGDDEYKRILEQLRLEDGDDDGGGDDGAMSEHMRAVFRACDEDGDDFDAETFEQTLAGALEVGEPANAKNADGETALHLAALYGKVAYVEVLLRRGADPLATDESLGTPLHDACASGHADVARALCDAARDAGTLATLLKKVDEDQETPLHHAARGEHAEVVKYLIELGADKSAKSSVGATPSDLVEDDDSVRALLAT